MSYNKCFRCGKEEYSAIEPIKRYVCDDCAADVAAEEQMEYEKELEAGLV